MPFIHVAMRKGTSSEYRRAIANSIHEGMLQSMKGLPKDDFFQLTHELDDDNFNFDPNYWNKFRSDKMIFIQFFWNARAAVVKNIIFETIADKLVATPGLRREDIIMNITECAPENWWCDGREIDPMTGNDSRFGK